MIRVGTAGWSIPGALAAEFPGTGTHLERYGRRLDAAEINSSFYRPHRRATYERWAASVPETFRFSVKLPKSITHERRLRDCGELVERFAGEVTGLGEKFGVLLVQLPPSLAFSQEAERFLAGLRSRIDGNTALEPRHPSWFAAPVEDLLGSLRIGRVAADPARAAGAGMPGGWPGLAYFRLHGSPRVYWSNYDGAALETWREQADRAAGTGAETWVIFDNTADGCALKNAIELRRL